MRQSDLSAAAAAGGAVMAADAAVIAIATRGTGRFWTRHPRLYLLGAFVLGGGAAGVLIMTAYTNWSFETVDLKAALDNILFGSLGAGVASAALAWGYARMVKTLAG